MVLSGPTQAKRALVKVLLTLAAVYSVRLTVSRDSPDDEVLRAFKRVLLKAHPDKGGLLAHSQDLNAKKEAWDKARQKQGQKAGRPKQRADTGAEQGASGQDLVEARGGTPGKPGMCIHVVCVVRMLSEIVLEYVR